MSDNGWGTISGSAETVLIVGTGPSASLLDYSRIPDHVHIIAVKDAITFLPRVNSWVTVDFNDRCIPHLQMPRSGVTYYAAMTPRQAMRYRYGALTYLRRLSIGDFQGHIELSKDPGMLVSGNSSFAALQIAVLKGAKKVLMVGVDATDEPHVSGGKPRGSLSHLPGLFAAVVPQLRKLNVRVATVGPQSRLRCFPCLHTGAAMKWLSAPRIAMVLGSAKCLWHDIESFLDMGEADGVVVAKGAGVVWPGYADAWASLHPEKMRNLVIDRQALGYPPIKRVFVHRMNAAGRRYCTDELDYKFEGQKASASSGLFAVKVAMHALHFDQVVMCGIPLDPSQGRLDGLDLWSGRRHFVKGFEEAVPQLQSRVRSMSGLTRELLGPPTPEWLAGSDGDGILLRPSHAQRIAG